MSETISGAMGIKDEWFESASEGIRSGFGKHDEMYTLMLEQLSEVRENEFGEVSAKFSDYEKKLILSGYILGVERIRLTSNPISSALDDLKRLFEKDNEEED